MLLAYTDFINDVTMLIKIYSAFLNLLKTTVDIFNFLSYRKAINV